MCSIAGVIAKDDSNVLPDLFHMLQITSHRGPNGAGIAFNKSILKSKKLKDINIKKHSSRRALGHLRLAITGATGIQPLKSEKYGFSLVFNGEIWKHKKTERKIKKSKISDGL